VQFQLLAPLAPSWGRSRWVINVAQWAGVWHKSGTYPQIKVHCNSQVFSITKIDFLNRMEPRQIHDERLLPLLDACILEAIKDLSTIRVDTAQPNQTTIACMYCSLIELAKSCVDLEKNNNISSVPIILRALTEVYADFRSSQNDNEYFKNMYASYLNEKLRFLDAFERNPNNQFLRDAKKEIVPYLERQKLNAELEQLKNEKRMPLKTWERFMRGGLLDEYSSVYWLLCLHSHSNLSAIEERHIQEDGEKFRVILFKDEDPLDLLRYTDTILTIIIAASIDIHRFMKTGNENKYMQYLESLEAIRKDFIPQLA